MFKMRGFTVVELFVALTFVAGCVGWVWNIIKIVQSDFVLTGLLIVRVIGIFVAPLGAVIGYF